MNVSLKTAHAVGGSFAIGIVTSASLMVRREAARAAAELAAAQPGLTVGLHLDLAVQIVGLLGLAMLLFLAGLEVDHRDHLPVP